MGCDRPRWWTERITPCARPEDFETVFVRKGRLECQEHYRVGRATINLWLNQSGKERLIRERAEHVARLGRVGRGAVQTYGREQVDQWRDDGRITRKDMGKSLAKAMPVRDHRFVNPNTARHAAQFLRINRNGGFIVSQTSDGDWRVGTKRVSPAQLVDMAKQKGFAE